MKKIGDRIRELRIAQRVTQEELADKCGVRSQTIYKYEKGIITNIPSDTLETIANALDTTPAYLMGWTEEEHPTDQQADEVSEERRELIEFCARLSEREAARMLRLMKAMLAEEDEHEV